MLQDSPPEELSEDEHPVLVDRLHGVIGTQLCRKWQLPPLIAEACRRHHVYRDYKDGGGYSQVGNLIAVADRLAAHHGMGRPARAINLGRDRCIFDLGLRPDQVEALIAEMGILAEYGLAA